MVSFPLIFRVDSKILILRTMIIYLVIILKWDFLRAVHLFKILAILWLVVSSSLNDVNSRRVMYRALSPCRHHRIIFSRSFSRRFFSVRYHSVGQQVISVEVFLHISILVLRDVLWLRESYFVADPRVVQRVPLLIL